MRRAVDLAGFLAQPTGAFLCGDSFAFYNLGTVCGWRVWGRPSRDEAKQLVACIATAYAPGAPPYHSLVDLRGLEGVDAAGFEVLLEFVKSKREQMATQLVRQAVVRPPGLLGALSSGFYVLLQPRHRVRVFDSMNEATGWLRPPDGGSLSALVEAFESTTTVSLVTGLRRWLASSLHEPVPGDAAKALGVSLRTMQRRLTAEKTSFNAQLRLARVEAAQRLLVDSDLKLAGVALDAGFPSSQQLATSFKEVTGMTPSEFRERYRGKLA
ncbi:MAG: helix-turn-helix transcriptional regulator [Archangium sp.]|nr:helix-turn-helix transcriptional regulator [Archangium sp.]